MVTKARRKTPTRNADDRILTRNITKGAAGKRISRALYDATRAGILALLPARGEGMLFTDLMKAMKRRVPPDVFAGASVPWYTTTVKLDLEARGLIERVPGAHPQRLRRVTR
jgi:hypothetical protein